jgi:hypothetical protein
MTDLPPSFMKMTESILEENDSYCKSNETAHKTWVEIVEMMNDAVDDVMWETKEIDWNVYFPRFAMLNYFFSVLMPVSYGIYLDFMAGNLPVCFTQLRTLLEQLAKCSVADREYPELPFFRERIIALEEKLKREHVTLTDLIGTMSEDGSLMWRVLSKDWVHYLSFERIATIVMERQDVPGWSLTIPIGYSATELSEIEELGKYVAQFRQVLRKTVEEWKASFADVSTAKN